jgi:Domain of unknown function (DUF1707)
MTDRPIRASDQDRDSVVDVLRDAYADGRLTLDEFSERTSAAYAAKTWGELRDLTGDLPAEPVFAGELAATNQTVKPASLPPAARRSTRDRPLGRLLPIVFIWIVISAAAGSPNTAAALSVVFLCLLACRAGHGGRW